MNRRHRSLIVTRLQDFGSEVPGMGDQRRSATWLLGGAILSVAAAVRGATPDEIAARLAADPHLEPLVPILEQCVERRASYQDDGAFFRSDYGALCGSVMVTFGVVSAAELDDYWRMR